MRRQDASDFAPHPFFDPRQRSLTFRSLGLERANQLCPRHHPLRAPGEACDGRALKLDLGALCQLEGLGRRRRNLREPRGQHRAHSGERRAAHSLAFQRAGIDNGFKAEAPQPANQVAFNRHIAVRCQVSHECIFFPQACKQGRGSPVHETRRQRLV